MVDIRMPDGRVVHFPDDVTEQQIREFMMRSHPRVSGGMAAAVPFQPQPSPPPNRLADAGAAGGAKAAENAAPAETGPFAGFADRLQAFGAALEDAMPRAASHGGSFPGNRRENGNALANVLNSPTVVDMLIKRRLNFLG